MTYIPILKMTTDNLSQMADERMAEFLWAIAEESGMAFLRHVDWPLEKKIDHDAIREKANAMTMLYMTAVFNGENDKAAYNEIAVTKKWELQQESVPIPDLRAVPGLYQCDFIRVGFPGREVGNPGRWYRMALLRDARQRVDLAHHFVQGIGDLKSRVVSKSVLMSRKIQSLAQQRYIKNTEIVKKDAQGIELIIPASDIYKTTEKRVAKLYVRIYGLEKFCTEKGLQGYFLTLTLPPSYHPNPSWGENSWDGSTPADGHKKLQHCWRAWQRSFGKTMSIRVEEQHKDGCPHWHALVWIKPGEENKLIGGIQDAFGKPPATEVVKIDLTKGSAATYVMKYVLKSTLGGEDAHASKLADAHRATWGGRAVQIADLLGSATIWDEIRRIRFGSDIWMELCNEAKALHSAAATNDYCEFLKILEAVNQPKKRCYVWYGDSSKGAELVQGLSFDNVLIPTHSKGWKLRPKKRY